LKPLGAVNSQIDHRKQISFLYFGYSHIKSVRTESPIREDWFVLNLCDLADFGWEIKCPTGMQKAKVPGPEKIYCQNEPFIRLIFCFFRHFDSNLGLLHCAKGFSAVEYRR